jgi:hypothetical protein
VDASTRNGGVTVDVLPVQGGSIEARASNGGVMVRVREDPSRGYDVDAQVDNGRATILLRDGDVGGDRTHATFRTEGYEQREIRTTVRAQTDNGSVTVAG